MRPEDFIATWRRNTRTEISAAHEHFINVCDLVGVEQPARVDPDGDWFTFEKHVAIDEQRSGFVDVWRKGCFAWEYKRSYENGEFNHKNLVKALSQVRDYAPALGNPPLLVVSDMKEIRIHTNFTNSISEQHVIQLIDLTSVEARRLLGWCFKDPEQLRPAITREGVTTKAALALGKIAGDLRGKGYEPQKVAHFLNRIVFCLFAEDIDLLPDKVFADILEESQKQPDDFVPMLRDLFRAMKDKDGRFGMLGIPWFNGGLFDDDDVLPLGYFEIKDLAAIARLDWSAIEPSIFGTLFESGLNPEKRKQMANLFDSFDVKAEKKEALPGILENPMADKGVGIHYTDPGTIMKIIEPVVLRPLEREWAGTKESIAEARGKRDAAKSDAARTRAENEARDLYGAFRRRLAAFRVLDPACGSGNFLYLALQHLKDFDLKVLREATGLGLPLDDQCVGPDAMLGIEINPYAAELARVTLWIGELQWQLNNGFHITRAPVLGNLEGIRCQDALMNPDGSEAVWPETSVIVGNPPFLGGKKMRANMGDDYVDRLFDAYVDRVPPEADLVTYWFMKAGVRCCTGNLERFGLVSTNSIRGGASRRVIKSLLDNLMIYDAWSDEPWVVDGAAVRVSLMSFCLKENPLSDVPHVNGTSVVEIYSDLTASGQDGGVDLTNAISLTQNKGVAFMGDTKGGAFDVSGKTAREWLKAPNNPNGKTNSDVVRPWVNGLDVTRRLRDMWIVDFGWKMSAADASLYELPFAYIERVVWPKRKDNARKLYRKYWWRHVEPRPGMWQAIHDVNRHIVTPTVAKHRLFKWFDQTVCPDHQLIAIARDDDATFGILHSRFHEVWSLRMCTWLGVGNDPRYTPSTTFETFPFPDGLTPDIPAADYASDPRAVAIAEAARELNEYRENWLNPPDLVKVVPEVVDGYPDRILPRNAKAEKELKKRTLTNLYNARPTWLDNAHRSLDAAVAAAYGWPNDLADDDILSRLFNLNQERAAAEAES